MEENCSFAFLVQMNSTTVPCHNNVTLNFTVPACTNVIIRGTEIRLDQRLYVCAFV